MLDLVGAFCMIIYALEVDTALKYTPKEVNNRKPPLFLNMPTIYMEWFHKYFPNIRLERVGPYVLQLLKMMQGIKQAGK